MGCGASKETAVQDNAVVEETTRKEVIEIAKSSSSEEEHKFLEMETDPMDGEYDVMITYADVDSATARRIYQDLSKDFKVWIHSDSKAYDLDITIKAISQSTVIVALLSSSYELNPKDSTVVQEASAEIQEPPKEFELLPNPESLKMEEEFKELLTHRMPQTGTWLEDDIKKFISSQSSVYWLYADDGFGKSILMATAIAQLRAQNIPHAYYFFKGKPTLARNLKRTLVALTHQLATQIPAFKSGLELPITSDNEVRNASTIGLVFKSLLLEPISRLPEGHEPIVIVLDHINSAGVAGEDDRFDFLEIISSWPLLTTWSKQPGLLKLIISSQPQDDIDHLLGLQDLPNAENQYLLRTLDFENDSGYKRDLMLFAMTKLGPLKGRLKKTESEMEEKARALIKAVHGQFKELSEACEDIRKAISPSAVLDKIIND
ncbi:hypothetical protein HDU97_002560 [Phlyctochytrium planicorne]|nr:hypothetical protein HDU97_002560 [Phlyctochytrium planicorne]